MRLLPIILASFCFSAWGQQETASYAERRGYAPLPDTLAQLVLMQNRVLSTAREQYRVASLLARTGNTPPNPKVELGYLFGKPEEMELIKTNHAALIPFFPMNITVYEKEDYTAISTIDPMTIQRFYGEKVLPEQFKRWHHDISAIVQGFKYCEEGDSRERMLTSKTNH